VKPTPSQSNKSLPFSKFNLVSISTPTSKPATTTTLNKKEKEKEKETTLNPLQAISAAHKGLKTDKWVPIALFGRA